MAQPKTNVATTNVAVSKEVTSPQASVNVEQAPAVSFSQSGEWKDVIKHLRDSGKMSLYATLVSTTANVSDSAVTINFSQAFGKTVVEKSENMATLKDAISSVIGKELPVKCIVNGANNMPDSDVTENTLLKSGIDVNIV